MIFNYFLISILIIAGCSSKKVEEQAAVSVPAKEVPQPPEIVIGPTNPTNKFFTESAKKYGLEGISASQIYAVDFNADGFTDLVTLPKFYSVPVFFEFDEKKKKFVKLVSSPFGEVLRASYLVFADFDKDGIDDVLVGTLNQKTELTRYPLRIFRGQLKNNSVSYREVSGAFPQKVMPTASVGVFDFDLDGWLDIYVGNWFDNTGTRPTVIPDKLYKGKKFSFSDISNLLEGEQVYNRSLQAHINARPTFGVSICDIDQNGYPDILTANSSGYANKLWISRKSFKEDGRIFRDYGVESGYAHDEEGGYNTLGGGNSFYTKCADYNNDGILDIAVGEIFHSYDPETRDRSSILTGSTFEFPPKFIRTEYHMDDGTGNWSQGDRRGVWVDINSDGLLDLLVDNSGFPPKSRLILFEQEVNHAYADVAKEKGINVLNPSSTVTMDINSDGRMDIVTGQTNLRNSTIKPGFYVFENNIPMQGAGNVRFYPRGKKANTRALGGLIILKTTKQLYRQMIEYSYGPQPGQNEEGIQFAIPKDEKMISVEIRWPVLTKDRTARSYPLVKNYDLSALEVTSNLTITLCEEGRLLVGRRNCR